MNTFGRKDEWTLPLYAIYFGELGSQMRGRKNSAMATAPTSSAAVYMRLLRPPFFFIYHGRCSFKSRDATRSRANPFTHICNFKIDAP